MAKNNVWQWSETAGSNTEINGNSLAENVMLPSGVNDSFREMMSQIITMEGKGSDVASAGTITLGTERYYHITGTTTITDIDFTDAVDGRWAWLIFDGALTLTHNSTTLKLPGGANITTAAGDRALFVQDSSDNIICLVYQRADASTYTTGTWTPALAFGGASTGITYTNQEGRFTKIGRLVVLEMFINLSSKGSATGVATLSGLPYPMATGIVAIAVPIHGTSFNTITSSPSLQLLGGNSAFEIKAPVSDTTLTHANFNNDTTIRAVVAYATTA